MIRTDGYKITFTEQATTPEAPADGSKLYLDDTPQFNVLYPDGYVIPAKPSTGMQVVGVERTKQVSPVGSWSLSGWSQDSAYDELHLVWGFRHDNASSQTLISRINADATAGNYYGAGYLSSVSSGAGTQLNVSNNTNGMLGTLTNYFAGTALASDNLLTTVDLVIYQYNKASAIKFWEMQIQGFFATTNAFCIQAGGKYLDTTNAVTSLYLAFTAGNIVAGSWFRGWVQ